jgi:hypothetical protein
MASDNAARHTRRNVERIAAHAASSASSRKAWARFSASAFIAVISRRDSVRGVS